MYYPTPAILSLQQAIPNSCPAKALPPSQRLQIGLQALAQAQSVTSLADEFHTSRKFVYQQRTRSQIKGLRTRLPLSRLTTRFCFNVLVTAAGCANSFLASTDLPSS